MINQDLKAFESPNLTMNEWLALAFRGLAPSILMANRKDGTTVQSIRFDQLKDLRLAIPPLAEQRRIVARVEALLGRVQAARARLAKVPALLKRFRRSVLAAACSSELTADSREAKPGMDARSIIEGIKAIRSHKQLASFPAECPDGNALSPTPRGWEWTTFGFVIGELQTGVSIRPNVDPPGNPILRISAVRPGRVLLDDFRYLPDPDGLLERFAIRDGDLLFTRHNGSLDLLGICGMVRGIGHRRLVHPDKLMRVRFDHDWIEPAYAEIFFQHYLPSPNSTKSFAASKPCSPYL